MRPLAFALSFLFISILAVPGYAQIPDLQLEKAILEAREIKLSEIASEATVVVPRVTPYSYIPPKRIFGEPNTFYLLPDI